MSHNWEFALSHVEEGWVTILGDDDAILPGAIRKVLKIVSETGVQAVRSNGCNYLWPQLLKAPFGRLNIRIGNDYAVLDSRKALSNVIDGKSHYNTLPMLYNGGFVDVDLIRRAKHITGDFYLSMTPDVYSAVALSHLVDKYVYSYEPLAINGASRHSGGTAIFSTKPKNAACVDPATKFYSEKNIAFHCDLPLLDNGKPPTSIQAVVYEAYLQALPLALRRDPNANHQRQLEIIIKTAGDHYDSIYRWAGIFCDMHGMDLDKFSIEKKRFSFRSFIDKLVSISSEFSIDGNSKAPLSNVFEASMVAGELLQVRPSWLSRMNSVVRQVIRRLNARIDRRRSLGSS